MKAELTEEAVRMIEHIVNHGNKAVVQRKGPGILVMEERRKICYQTPDETER